MNKISKKTVALLAVVLVAALLGGCSIGAQVAKGALDKAVKNAENALATVQASLQSEVPQETPQAQESAAPATQDDDNATQSAQPASGEAGGWNADIPPEVPKFSHGLYQKENAAKYSTDEGTIISASFADTTKEDAQGYVKALKDSKFDMSTLDMSDDLSAVGTLKKDTETINIVCGYKNDDHSFSIVVTIAKNK